MSIKMLELTDVTPGDLLLFFKLQKNADESRVAELTESQYTHSGIFLGDGQIAHQTSEGVIIEPLRDTLDGFDHAAVFRRHDLWSQRRLEILKLFAARAQSAKTRYNLRGLLKFMENRAAHEANLQSDLINCFDGNLQPEPSVKKQYHCSEFVVACFTATGIIEPSAAIVYRGSVISPGDLGRDATFGFFDGYVTLGGQVQSNDDFINEQPFSEILKEWAQES
jgi:hypothetical protein